MMKKYGERTNRPHKICLHAEISALVRTAQPSHSIMVLRVNRNGDLAMAKPCPLCRMAIADANIQRIYYSDMDGDIVCLNPKEEL
jgi:tRNA(Arg) A34 adenosine deaminase TadA